MRDITTSQDSTLEAQDTQLDASTAVQVPGLSGWSFRSWGCSYAIYGVLLAVMLTIVLLTVPR